MNETQTEVGDAPLTSEELQSAMFAQMVMQLASTALVLVGRMPNPMTGKTEIDLDAARLFIDQLEMLEVKTRGNLTDDEQHLLKQNLMSVRMAFVQAVETGPTAPVATAESSAPGSASLPADSDAEDTKKKFSKNYGAP